MGYFAQRRGEAAAAPESGGYFANRRREAEQVEEPTSEVASPSPQPAAPDEPAAEPPTLLERVKARLGGAARAAGRTFADTLNPAAAYIAGTTELAMPGAGQAAAKGTEQAVTLGGGDEARGILSGVKAALLPPSAGGSQTLGQAVDAGVAATMSDRAENAQLAKDQPVAFYGSQLAGSLALPAPGAGLGTAGRLAAGTGMAAATGALSSNADSLEGVAGDAAKAGAAGLAVGAAVAGAGKLARTVKARLGADAVSRKVAGVTDADLLPAPDNGPGAAELAYRHVVIDAIADGSTPTAQKRAWPGESAKQAALDLVEKTPKLKTAVTAGDRAKISEAAQEVIEKTAERTRPVYQELDSAGLIPIKGLDKRIADELKDLARPGRRHEAARVPELGRLRKDIRGYAKEHGGEHVSHQQLRDLATSFLKTKNLAVGGIQETQQYAFRTENHRLVNEFLNDHLYDLARSKPDLAPKIADLRADNRDIASAIGIRDVADDVVATAERKQPTRPQEVRAAAEKLQKRLTGASATGMALEGGRRALAKVAGIPTDGAALERYTADQVRRWGELARAIRTGAAPAQVQAAAEKARSSGVPEKAIRAIIVGSATEE